jgi:hypothetical protein
MQLVSTVGRFFWPERPRFGESIEKMHMQGNLPADRRGLYHQAVNAFDEDRLKLQRFTLASAARSQVSAFVGLAGFIAGLGGTLAVANPMFTLGMLAVGGTLALGGLASCLTAQVRRQKALLELNMAPVYRQMLTAGRTAAQLDGPTPYTNLDWERVRAYSHLRPA